MSLLRRIEKTLDQRLRSIFSGPRGTEEAEAREAIELYRDAMEQVGQRAQLGRRGERIFPFNQVLVELHAPSAERRAILEALFDPAQLLEDIRSTLHEERAEPPADLKVEVAYSADAAVELRVLCEKTNAVDAMPVPEQPASGPVALPGVLITVNGTASEQNYPVAAERLNLGREPEVTDNLGRLIRRNQLYFPDADHPANSTVSRSHAHIALDTSSGEWRLFDDGSTLGTSLFRNGHRIEVPAHGGRGVLLRAGDEIYLGQVRLRFEKV